MHKESMIPAREEGKIFEHEKKCEKNCYFSAICQKSRNEKDSSESRRRIAAGIVYYQKYGSYAPPENASYSQENYDTFSTATELEAHPRNMVRAIHNIQRKEGNDTCFTMNTKDENWH